MSELLSVITLAHPCPACRSYGLTRYDKETELCLFTIRVTCTSCGTEWLYIEV